MGSESTDERARDAGALPAVQQEEGGDQVSTITMQRPAVFGDIDWSESRRGTQDAIGLLVDRLGSGEPYTTIVLPTRYGKSDVFRVGGFVAKRAGYIATTVVLSPNVILRNQTIDPVRVQRTIERYKISAGEFATLRIPEVMPNPWQGDEVLLASTTQLWQRNVDLFAKWVRSVVHRTGVPPLIVIDEAHMESDSNTWGKCVEVLVDAGARALLLTATPFRADGQKIPGFECEEVESESTKEYVPRLDDDGKRWIDEYESVRKIVRLRAHHETTFREAWDEVPAPICKLGPVWFDVGLRELGMGDANDPRRLKDLSASEVRPLLGRVTREEMVVNGAAERVVAHLANYRALRADCAAIIYSGNDDDPAGQANKHARAISACIERLNPKLDVVIATSAKADAETEDSATKRIQDFTDKGRGDVLIVKQMAGMGLDSPRIKVGADLAPIRSLSSWMQRAMRVGTPYGSLLHGTWISPQDVLAVKIFKRLITTQGGERTTVRGDIVRSYEPSEGPGKEKRVYAVADVCDGDFEDSHFHQAGATDFPGISALVAAWPAMIEGKSHAELAADLKARGLILSVAPVSDVEVLDTVVVRDMTQENEKEYKKIFQLIKDIVTARHGFVGDGFGDLCAAVNAESRAPLGIRASHMRQTTNNTLLVAWVAQLESLRDAAHTAKRKVG